MITRYSLVSSANIFVMYLTGLDRSLTKSKNKSGEIRAPCATPAVILSSWSRPAATRYDYKTNHRKPSQTTPNHRKPLQTTARIWDDDYSSAVKKQIVCLRYGYFKVVKPCLWSTMLSPFRRVSRIPIVPHPAYLRCFGGGLW